MATVNLTLPNGTTVKIEGSAEEVAALLSKYSGSSIGDGGDQPPVQRRSGRKGTSKSKRPRRKGPQVFIDELAKENYFKSKRTIGEVQKKLEEKGHIYGQESLSCPLLRLTRD